MLPRYISHNELGKLYPEGLFKVVVKLYTNVAEM